MKFSKMILLLMVALSFAACKNDTIENNIADNSELLQEVKNNLNGYKIAYSTESNIMMMDVDGTNVEELADAAPISGYISWSIDAQFVYYASAKGPSETAWEAWRVNTQTKETTQLSDFGRDVRSLGVSPDNKYLAISLMTGNSNIGNNNDNLTQFNTDMFIVEMERVEQILSSGSKLKTSDLTTLVSSPPSDQFWYEELNWNPIVPLDGVPVLTYTKTWRYDEDEVSYTHAYTIKADGTESQLIAENQDMPIWNFEGTKISFLGLGVYDLMTDTIHQLQVSGISREVSGATISPDGKYILFEVGDENRQGGIARYNSDSSNMGEVLQANNVYEPRWSPIEL